MPTAAVVAESDGDDTGEATHFRGDALVRHGDARAARLGGATTPRTTSLGERLGCSTFMASVSAASAVFVGSQDTSTQAAQTTPTPLRQAPAPIRTVTTADLRLCYGL